MHFPSAEIGGRFLPKSAAGAEMGGRRLLYRNCEMGGI
jgi:hypothetical protein